MMKLARIAIKNYKVLQDVVLEDLTDVVVFIGANGTGKSTLLDVLEFLAEALRDDVSQALERRGGFERVVSRGQDGPIELVLGLRDSRDNVIEYAVTIRNSAKGVDVARETVRFTSADSRQDFEVLGIETGAGTSFDYRQWEHGQPGARTATQVKSHRTDLLFLSVIGRSQDHFVLTALMAFLGDSHIVDLRSSDAPASPGGERLLRNGENLAAVAHRLYKHHPQQFEHVLEGMRRFVPGLQRVTAEETIDKRIVLSFSDGAFRDPFGPRDMSDGTLRLFAYLVLLADPKPRALLCIEEPENQLYPTVLMELLEDFRVYARFHGQVFVSTHAPDMLDAADANEVRWFVKRGGYASARRIEPKSQLQAFIDAGDPPGALWRQRLLEGVDP